MKYMKPKVNLNGGRAVVLALVVATVLVVVSSAFLSWFVYKGNAELLETTVFSYAFVYVSVLVGSLIAARGGRDHIAIRAIIFCVLYFLVQISTGVVLLDCDNINVWVELLIVLLACGTGCAICIMKANRKRKRKKVIR